jgi:hypothetical protein
MVSAVWSIAVLVDAVLELLGVDPKRSANEHPMSMRINKLSLQHNFSLMQLHLSFLHRRGRRCYQPKPKVAQVPDSGFVPVAPPSPAAFFLSSKRASMYEPPSPWLRDKTFGLGLINMSLFVILNVTGILLMFYYVPYTDKAYNIIKDLQFVVSFGAVFRNMHRWSAYAMIVLVFLHMSRVFYTAEYREPREFNWVIGLVLFLCTLVASLTGYLLPWDQKAYWGMTIMSNVMASGPLSAKNSSSSFWAVQNRPECFEPSL